MARIGGRNDPAAVDHLETSLLVYRRHHEADLVQMGRHQDPEIPVRTQHAYGIPNIVGSHLVGQRFHIFSDDGLSLFLIAGYRHRT